MLPEFLNPDSSVYEGSKVFTDGRYYVYNQKAFIKSCLVLREESGEKGIVMLLWVSMDSKLFINFAKSPDEYDGIFSTKVFSKIPFYDNSENIDVNIDFKIIDDDGNPYMSIPENSSLDSLLKDFKFGLSKEKFENIHSNVYS